MPQLTRCSLRVKRVAYQTHGFATRSGVAIDDFAAKKEGADELSAPQSLDDTGMGRAPTRPA